MFEAIFRPLMEFFGGFLRDRTTRERDERLAIEQRARDERLVANERGNTKFAERLLRFTNLSKVVSRSYRHILTALDPRLLPGQTYAAREAEAYASLSLLEDAHDEASMSYDYDERGAADEYVAMSQSLVDSIRSLSYQRAGRNFTDFQEINQMARELTQLGNEKPKLKVARDKLYDVLKR